jgi:hypothetical protein
MPGFTDRHAERALPIRSCAVVETQLWLCLAENRSKGAEHAKDCRPTWSCGADWHRKPLILLPSAGSFHDADSHLAASNTACHLCFEGGLSHEHAKLDYRSRRGFAHRCRLFLSKAHGRDADGTTCDHRTTCTTSTGRAACPTSTGELDPTLHLLGGLAGARQVQRCPWKSQSKSGLQISQLQRFLLQRPHDCLSAEAGYSMMNAASIKPPSPIAIISIVVLSNFPTRPYAST